MVTSTGVTPAPVSLVHLLQGASPDSRIIVVTTPQGFLAITLINGVDLMRLRFEITATSVGLPAATDMHMVPARGFATVHSRGIEPLDWDSACHAISTGYGSGLLQGDRAAT